MVTVSYIRKLMVVLNVYRLDQELKKDAGMCILYHINLVALLAIVMELGHYGLVMEYVLHGALDDFQMKYLV